MTPEERIDRAQRAALFAEFAAPALDDMRAEYMSALSKIALDEPWEAGKMAKLAVAQRAINKVEEQMRAAMIDGAEAARQNNRAEEIARLPEAKRRWLNIAPQ